MCMCVCVRVRLCVWWMCVVITTFPLWLLNKYWFICSIIHWQWQQIGNRKIVEWYQTWVISVITNGNIKLSTELLANRRWIVRVRVCLRLWNVYQVQCSMSGPYARMCFCVQITIYAQTKGSMCWSIALFRSVSSSIKFLLVLLSFSDQKNRHKKSGNKQK